MAEIIQFPPRYTRSVHIIRDYAHDAVGVRDYQISPLVLQTTERVLDGLNVESTERAFSIIGPYGSGKSAFAVFLAHYLGRDATGRQQLIAEHSSEHSAQQHLPDAPRMLPVLISGSNRSLRYDILNNLVELVEQYAELQDSDVELRDELHSLIRLSDVDPQRVADIFLAVCREVARHTPFQGVVLVIDELGQYLSYATHQIHTHDVFVLQTLAETVARMTTERGLLITILHQSFERYASTVGEIRRLEWAKVQGRFTELPFQEPAVQMLRMVGSALLPKTHDPFHMYRWQWAGAMAQQSKALGIQPQSLSDQEWQGIVARSFPLHPTVLVALPLLFRQLAQNERSLFAFLCSPEPHGIQEFVSFIDPSQVDTALDMYRLTNLFKYMHVALGSALYGKARGQRWAELTEALSVVPESDVLKRDILTIIGTLGALGQTRGLRASTDQIVFALEGLYSPEEVQQGLQDLQLRKHIVYRQHRSSFVIWEGSDLDLDELTQMARRSITQQFTLVTLLEQHAKNKPLIARRHSYQTGTARAFQVKYVDPEELVTLQPTTDTRHGEILYVVPTNDEGLTIAANWATHASRRAETQRIVVLPRNVGDVRDALLDVAAIESVLQNQPELENDRVARRELTARLFEAQHFLSAILSDLYKAHNSRWFWNAEEALVHSARHIDELLSNACDTTYRKAPRIWNELIVRRQLSSAAAKARRNLIEAVLNQPHVNRLGLTGYPPERAIFESVFGATGIHQQGEEAFWGFGRPNDADPANLQPVWDKVQEFIDTTEDHARPLVELYQQLEEPPFGVVNGVLPLLVIAVYMANAGEIAWYEHGNYVPTPDITMFERLLRQPGYFSIRRSRATGARLVVIDRLVRTLVPTSVGKPTRVAILDAVMPLLRLIHALPGYSKKTHRISTRAQSVRQALLDARSPDELLFERLPLACGVPTFAHNVELDSAHVDAFFVVLSQALQDLQGAYTELKHAVRDCIQRAFHSPANDSELLRSELTDRYLGIQSVLNDRELRSMGVRLENADDGDAWLESVAALVGRKPLDTWYDEDVSNFEMRIVELGRRFRIVEQIAIASQNIAPGTSVRRVGISDGNRELSSVIRTTTRPPLMNQLYEELHQVLTGYDTLTADQKVAVLMELLQPNLQETISTGGEQ